MFRFLVSFFVIFFTVQINGCPPSSRIINGHDVDISEAPYMVQVRFEGKGRLFLCGGSIITEKFIATAGHCIEPDLITTYYIRAGSTGLELGGQVVALQKIIRHPEYEYKEAERILLNDFGLMLLEKSLRFGPNVQPIQLAKSNVAVDEMMFATGWGKYECNSGGSPTLQGAHFPMISDDKCERLFGGYHPSFICAGTFDEGVSTYHGDSGGALAVNNTLYGITSFGIPEEVPYYPVAYASVAYAYEWFKEEIENMGKNN